jgi:hypothetical protein
MNTAAERKMLSVTLIILLILWVLFYIFKAAPYIFWPTMALAFIVEVRVWFLKKKMNRERNALARQIFEDSGR